jgi:hypothetical protein
MYYTGTSDTSGFGYCGKIFHATSSDHGNNWSKLGPVSISGFSHTCNPQTNPNFGYGEASVLYENGTFRLYYFVDRGSAPVIAAAEGTPNGVGHTFTFKGYVTDVIGTSPEVRKVGSQYIMVLDSEFYDQGKLQSRILKLISTNPYFSLNTNDPYNPFASSWTCILKSSQIGGWDSLYLASPSILPGENRLYYAGNHVQLGNFDDSQIGFTIIPSDRQEACP